MENTIALKRKKKKAMDRWGVFDYVNILLMLLHSQMSPIPMVALVILKKLKQTTTFRFKVT